MIRKFILAFIFIAGIIPAQIIYTQKDVEICTSKFQLAIDKQLQQKPINEIIVEIGKSFIGLDYEAGVLDKPDKEIFVIHLSGLDCYTFLENTLVISRCIKTGKILFNDYQKELLNVRYRNGELNGYPSRLHYFTDWIFDCSKRGIIKDITQAIGGVPYKKKINFMSTHTDSYRQLKNNPDLVKDIIAVEKEINKRNYYYIPDDKLAGLEKDIKSGDLIAITTSIEGLDVSHVGIAVRLEDGKIHLMHSPNVGKKIEISELPLADILLKSKSQTGVIVARATE